MTWLQQTTFLMFGIAATTQAISFAPLRSAADEPPVIPIMSTDVEAHGPIPGPNSMLSFGSAAYLADKTLVSTFTANLEMLPAIGLNARSFATAAQIPKQVERIRYSPPADFQKLPWSEAFDEMHKKLAREYAFTDWRRIDWAALHREFSPRVVKAQVDGDFAAYYTTLREYLFTIRDGHVGVAGPDRGLRLKHASGDYGFVAAPLDDGRVIAYIVPSDGAAALAGMRAGATILRVNGDPVKEAVERISTLWVGSQPATDANRRLEQHRFLTRGPAGSQMTVEYRNPGEPKPVSASLLAVADGLEMLKRTAWSKPCPADRRVTHTVLPSGYGYVGIFEESGPALTELREALTDLIARGVTGLVLDLRSNRGGDDQMAADMAGFFHTRRSFYEYAQYFNLDTGTFDILKSDAAYVRPQLPHFDAPVVAVIGPGTGSSGEGVAWQIGLAPRGRTLGFAGTGGYFGMSGGIVRMPEGLTVYFPNGTSLDAKGRVQIDSNYSGRGGILPQERVPHTYDNLIALGSGIDVEMAAAERLLDKMKKHGK